MNSLPCCFVGVSLVVVDFVVFVELIGVDFVAAALMSSPEHEKRTRDRQRDEPEDKRKLFWLDLFAFSTYTCWC